MRLRIESLAYKGPGVARAADGRAVFVRGGCPGDIVEARVSADRGRFLEAEVLEVPEPSQERATPPCPYFGVCGGCQWQHVSYSEQLRAKRRIVTDLLSHVGRIADPSVDECVPSPSEYGYRNRVEFTVSDDGGVVLGYVAVDGETVLEVKTCMLPPEQLWKAPGALGGALRFALKQPHGVFRVALKAARCTCDVEVDLWGAPGPFPRRPVAKTLADALRPTTITRVLARRARERTSAKVEVLAGHGAWHEIVLGRDLLVSAPSFFQANTAVAEALARSVVDALAPTGADRILDLYAGVGTFTLPLASAARETVAVEGQGSAVRDLRRNLAGARLEALVLPGDAARALVGQAAFDSAVVDPPRGGLPRAALAGLVACAPRRIAYVSCDPATLARDVSHLARSGYRLRTVTPFDMFPQTYHVETLAVLDR